MSFHMPKGARDYFGLIDALPAGRPKFGLMFDPFYLCLMVGLDARKLGKEEDLTERFIEGYPDQYHNQRELIAGLLIDAELDRQAISLGDSAAIQGLMIELLDPQSSTSVSAEGLKRLNLYAVHGFDLVRERIARPDTLENFLVAYHRLLQSPPV
jgi:hypothetical protein